MISWAGITMCMKRSSAVVHVHKKILSWGDTYAIEFDDPKHEIPALLLVLAIDAANCSQNNS